MSEKPRGELELELADLFNDDRDRESRTARHEAGHAAAAWLICGAGNQPPFEYIELGSIAEQAGGVVPGGVKYDRAWFEALDTVDKGAILLAGVYAQDYAGPYDADDWRELLASLEGANGVDDYARVILLARDQTLAQHDFDASCLARLEAMEPELGRLVELICAQLVPGNRVPADRFVSLARMIMKAAPEGG